MSTAPEINQHIHSLPYPILPPHSLASHIEERITTPPNQKKTTNPILLAISNRTKRYFTNYFIQVVFLSLSLSLTLSHSLTLSLHSPQSPISSHPPTVTFPPSPQPRHVPLPRSRLQQQQPWYQNQISSLRLAATWGGCPAFLPAAFHSSASPRVIRVRDGR